MAQDVQAKLERMEFTHNYRDQFENFDHQELERIVDETVQTTLPEEGHDHLTDNEKVMIGLKARF